MKKPQPPSPKESLAAPSKLNTSMPEIMRFNIGVNNLDAAREYKRKIGNGNGAILSMAGCMNMPTTTSYQETYTTRKTANYKRQPVDFNTSLVGRMSPDHSELAKGHLAHRRASSTLA